MKRGDLVKVKANWLGYNLTDEREIIAVVNYFEQDFELDENLEYKLKAYITSTQGRNYWVFMNNLEIISKKT